METDLILQEYALTLGKSESNWLDLYPLLAVFVSPNALSFIAEESVEDMTSEDLLRKLAERKLTFTSVRFSHLYHRKT